MNAALKAYQQRDRERLLASRTYPTTAPELIEFFRKRAPKSEATIRLDGPGVEDVLAMERLNDRAESMARAAERSGKFDDRTWLELVDAAGDYIAK